MRRDATRVSKSPKRIPFCADGKLHFRLFLFLSLRFPLHARSYKLYVTISLMSCTYNFPFFPDLTISFLFLSLQVPLLSCPLLSCPHVLLSFLTIEFPFFSRPYKFFFPVLKFFSSFDFPLISCPYKLYFVSCPYIFFSFPVLASSSLLSSQFPFFSCPNIFPFKSDLTILSFQFLFYFLLFPLFSCFYIFAMWQIPYG